MPVFVRFKLACPNSLCSLVYKPFSSFYFQGVLRVRKRVTLSVITVSAIFGVCWITGLLIYILSYYDIYMFGPASYAISDTMFMFNSAINPFVYSLLNERFRGKLQGMCCYKCAVRVQPSSEPYSMQLPNNTSRATNTAGACLDWQLMRYLCKKYSHILLTACGRCPP